jgi:hypothetical protein
MGKKSEGTGTGIVLAGRLRGKEKDRHGEEERNIFDFSFFLT